ncbi:MAG: ABC transporter substrate-binding protein [Deltaproteobacteria bacterium]|nr:ABC transporter substrate-binding protein [Deltaproteobacteria bacterium]
MSYTYRGFFLGLMLAVLLACPPDSMAASEKLQKVTFRYSWILYGQAPVYYYAKELGFFEKEGLDVTILTGQGSGTSVKLMGTGETTFGEADYATMMKGIAQGVPVIGIYGIAQIHPLAVATRDDVAVKSPKDLVGKSIAVAAGGADQAILPAFLAANGLTGKVRVVQLSSGGAKREALLQNKVDAIVAYVNEQVPQIEDTGVKLDVLRFADYGAPLLGTGILINRDNLKQKEMIRAFLRAVSRGFIATMKNPEAAADAALKEFKERKRSTVLHELTASFPLFHSAHTKDKPLGWMDKRDWETAQQIMFEYGDLKKKLPVDRYFTNEFIPMSVTQ